MNKTFAKHVTIHLTSRCNLKCAYCHTASQSKISEGVILQNLIRNLLTCKDMRSVSLAGGEPLFLGNEMWELVKNFKHSGIESIAITTNGVLWSERDFLKCVDNGIRLQFSIDGTKDVHDKLRGAGVYDIAVGNLATAVKLGIRCDVLYTVSKRTIQAVSEAVQQLERTGVSQITFLHFSPKGRASQYPDDDFQRDEWLSFIKSLSNLTTHIRLLVQLCFLPKVVAKNMDSERRIWQCNWHKCDYLYLDARTGDVYPCGLAYKTLLKIGSIKHQPLYTLCYNHVKNMQKASAICSGCNEYTLCYGGARCVCYWNNKGISSKDPRCSNDEWLPICPFASMPVSGFSNLLGTIV